MADFDDSDVKPPAEPPVNLQTRIDHAATVEHGKRLAAIETSLEAIREMLRLAIVDTKLIASIERRLKNIEKQLADEAQWKGP